MKITLDIPDGIIAGFFNSYNTRDLVIDLGNSVPHPDRFNCPYVNRIGQLTVSVLLNRFARKEHRT